MRDDIVGSQPLSEMTLEALAFRRNGLLHDIAALYQRGARDMREQAIAAQSNLAEVEAEIAKRLVTVS